MKPIRKAWIGLHTAVFLWGFTAIIGKEITFGSFNLVWYRMLIASVVYFAIPSVYKGIALIPKKKVFHFVGIGTLVAIHWLCFYGSIKVANSASLTLGCLGMVSVFSALLEPLLTRTSFKPPEMLMSLFVLIGLYLIYLAKPEDAAQLGNYINAIILGVLAAFFAALFSVLNKISIGTNSSLAVSAIELGSGWLFLSVLLPFIYTPDFVWVPVTHDLIWLVVLSVLCTNLTFFLGMYALKYISAFASNLALNLEPVYGIILAALYFKEYESLNVWFYSGAFIILITVFTYPIIMYKKKS